MDKIPKYKGIDLMYKIHNTYTVCKKEEIHQSHYSKHDDWIENLNIQAPFTTLDIKYFVVLAVNLSKKSSMTEDVCI